MPPSTLLKQYGRNESGATAIEYALVAAMMAVVVVAIFATGQGTEAVYNTLLAIVEAIGGGDDG